MLIQRTDTASVSVDPNDRTDASIRAFLASLRPMRDCIYPSDIEKANQRGRALIERLALSAEEGDVPRLRLPATEVADVLSFLHCTEPEEPATWWADGGDTSHVVGYHLVLQALQASVRELGGGADPSRSDSTITLGASRKQFEHLLGELNAAACIMGTVRDALVNTGGYEVGGIFAPY